MQNTTTFRASRSVPFLERLGGIFAPRQRVAARESHELRAGEVERIAADVPVEVSCPEGRLWITQDGGGPDIVLDSGESRFFARRGGLLVEALQNSTVILARQPTRAA